MGLDIQLATPADDGAIRGLCRRESMPGRVAVRYEREPNFSLGCRVTGKEYQVVVARDLDSGEVVGVACRSTRELFLNGEARRFGYLGQLRIDERYRGRWLVSRGFAMLKELHEKDPVPGYLASIVGGNEEAEGVLVRKARSTFPEFRGVAEFQTLAVSLGRAKKKLDAGAEICGASDGELEEIAEFLRREGARRQLFPVWTEDELREMAKLGLRIEDIRVARRGGKIVGLAGLWDQSAYKQTVVEGYSGWMKAAAPLYNLCEPVLGRPALPRPGSKLRSVYAAMWCVAGDDLQLGAAVFRELYNTASVRGFDYLLVGVDARDPMLAVVKKYSHVLYPSRLYMAEWPNGGKLHERLDHRVAYVDIATL